ncbi:MAG: ammonium transporter [Deltaproteobacteria bacterium]|nr:ammonium transporter [Deltaproteobacteria bacterium]
MSGSRSAPLARRILSLAPVLALFCARSAFAQDEAPKLDAGNTAWVLTSSALVLMMTLPGLALFYGGLVRAKNTLSLFMQCLVSAGVVGVLWILIGYSLAFAEGNAVIGGLGKLGLAGITPDTLWGSYGIPEYLFVMFQAMFAIITPALMIGAFAERMRFGPYLAFITIWLLVVYCPLAHMVWGGGYIGTTLGAKDFAGGLVVHMSSGFSALVVALVLGKRRGFGKEPMPPHNLPFAVIGAALLWVGWFGFNAGSELMADGIASLAFLTTSTAASTALVTWVAIEWAHRGKPTVLGAATACVAGLVAITPACAFVAPMGSIAIGAGAALLSYLAVTFLKPALGYDDSLDVFGVHGIGGAWGALATGLFIADFALPEGVTRGDQILIQITSVVVTAIFAPLATLLILLALRAIFGSLRVDDEAEFAGLDLAEHSESAYEFGTASGTSASHMAAGSPAPAGTPLASKA